MAGSASNGEKLIGKVISGYVLVEVVGTCRWGPVYSAIQTSMDRAVALKVLAPEFAGESDQFLAEARLAAQITHPRIVTVFEAGFADGCYFCATEFTDGPPLAEFLRKGDAVDEHRLLETIAGLAEALETLWQRGVAHLSPTAEHIVTTREGVAKLSELEPVKNSASKSEKNDIAALGFALGTIVNNIGLVRKPVGELVERMAGMPGRKRFATPAELLAEAMRLDHQLFPPLLAHRRDLPEEQIRKAPWWVFVLAALGIIGVIAACAVYVFRNL
jgi:serine/threonine protein kinase